MDGLRGLHQAKLGHSMRAPVVLDERGDGHMDRHQPLRLHARFTKPSEGHTRPKRCGTTLDVHRRLCPSCAVQESPKAYQWIGYEKLLPMLFDPFGRDRE